MEIQSHGEPYGAKIELKKDHDKAVFGRGFGFNTEDRTVSRRHVAFELKSGAKQTEPTIIVSFEVLGKNPVWVARSEVDEAIRVFRRSEKGELAAGDRFCVSGKKPAWFGLREIGAEEDEKRVSGEGEMELAEGSGSGSEFEGFDVSGIDPVKEFGFLVIGHEFDHYPRHMIRDVKRWEWFLEEDGKESEDEDEDEDEGDFEKKRGVRKKARKRKKGEENQDDDEDWTGESEDDIELVRKANDRPKYSTRSKDRDKPRKNNNSQGSGKASQKKVYIADDDKEDETLGGFIVGDEDVDQEVDQTNGDEEEEEEFVDDDEEEDE